MKNEYSQHLRDVIEYSREEAERLQNSYIGPEHLLLAIIRDGAGLAYDVLGRFLTIPNVKKRIEEQIRYGAFGLGHLERKEQYGSALPARRRLEL